MGCRQLAAFYKVDIAKERKRKSQDMCNVLYARTTRTDDSRTFAVRLMLHKLQERARRGPLHTFQFQKPFLFVGLQEPWKLPVLSSVLYPGRAERLRRPWARDRALRKAHCKVATLALCLIFELKRSESVFFSKNLT